MNKIICLVGMPGAGKSVVADALVKRGHSFLRFGQITLDIVKERGLLPTEENERAIREDIRKKHGMAAYAILNYPKFKELLEKGNVVGDGLYSWEEYKFLKEKFGYQMIVISVFAPAHIRHERISKRVSDENDIYLRHRSFTKDEAHARDYAEIENLAKGGPIALADHTLVNTGTMEEFIERYEALLNVINEKHNN
jgi:dephospho-CoA kinase